MYTKANASLMFKNLHNKTKLKPLHDTVGEKMFEELTLYNFTFDKVLSNIHKCTSVRIVSGRCWSSTQTYTDLKKECGDKVLQLMRITSSFVS